MIYYKNIRSCFQVHEINFINTLEAENRRHDALLREKDSEMRLQTIQANRIKKVVYKDDYFWLSHKQSCFCETAAVGKCLKTPLHEKCRRFMEMVDDTLDENVLG